MKKTKKHAAPLRCRLEVWLRGPSPSRMICCRIGCRGYTGAKRAKCQDCEENIARAAYDGLVEALDRLARTASAAAITLEIAAKNAKEASQAEE